MKRPLILRIFGGLFFTVLVTVTLVVLFSFQTIRSHYIENETTHLKDLTRAVLVQLSPLLDVGHERLTATVVSLGGEIETRITLIDPRGLVIADSVVDPETMENHRARPEVLTALTGNTGQAIRYSTTRDRDMLYVTMPLRDGSLIRGVLRLSVPLQQIDELLDKLQGRILLITMTVTLLSLLIALIFAHHVSRPISDLRHAARRVAGGDFAARVDLGRGDELRELSGAFNEMTEQLAAAFAETSRRTAELEQVLATITEGLLVLDPGGRILAANPAMAAIAKQEQLEGRYYWEVLRSPGLEDLEQLAETTREGTSEVELEGRTYLAGAGVSESLTVLVLHDITEMRRMEQVKRDLVTNVSHELRTPLTAIKGFTETIHEDDTNPEHAEYLAIIARHTDRLINIVGDLLNLSELEKHKPDLRLAPADLDALLRHLTTTFTGRAHAKGLTLTRERPPEPVIITADAFRLEQLFTNLIDNALKYTEAGAVTVSIIPRPDHIQVAVADTGPGIPPEHLPRIFERFYVVDKSRSRSLGGTGLGLAICKHIALLHQGTIKVQSTPGEGSTFTVTLPRRAG